MKKDKVNDAYKNLFKSVAWHCWVSAFIAGICFMSMLTYGFVWWTAGILSIIAFFLAYTCFAVWQVILFIRSLDKDELAQFTDKFMRNLRL